MEDFPHRYVATARAQAEGTIALESPGIPSLDTEAPASFGGPGDRWSPETLLVGAVADCFILTFRAVARASKIEWLSLECEAEGTLDRIEKSIQFTAIRVRASLRVPAGTDRERAQRILERTERACLVTQSLKAQSHLEAEVVVAP